MRHNKWFIRSQHRSQVDLRIFCFPYAGGSAATYLPWTDWLPYNVELVAIQPPGRATRMLEPAHSNMQQLIAQLIPNLSCVMDRPYIMLGHSVGSRVAFELLNQLSKYNYPYPHHFIASGSRGPHIKSTNKPTHHLPDDDFIKKLRELNGTPEAVLQNDELMALFLPMLRADFKLSETYLHSSSSIFSCPISVLSGKEDTDISLADLKSWGQFFSHPPDLHILPGGHFFIEEHRGIVKEKLLTIVQGVLSKLSLETIRLDRMTCT